MVSLACLDYAVVLLSLATECWETLPASPFLLEMRVLAVVIKSAFTKL